MAKFYNNGIQPPFDKQLSRYNNARNSILLAIVFTVVNLVLLLTESYTYFVFSISVPYIILDMAMLMCGRYPEEYYEGDLESMVILDDSIIYIALLFAVIILALYLLFFFLSKRLRVGFIIAALVFFTIDTLFLVFAVGISADIIIDLVFHGIFIVELILAISAYGKLSQMPEFTQCIETGVVGVYPTETQYQPISVQDSEYGFPNEWEGSDLENTPHLRSADFSVKYKTLLEADVLGHKVLYRRVDTTNELVIDGRVYDEYTARFETFHELIAVIDGHEISAGFDGAVSSFINLDGQTVAKKTRLI
jgi:hypothetical protein